MPAETTAAPRRTLPSRGVEELAGVVAVHHEHDEPETDGQGDEDVGAHPTLGGERGHVAAETLALDHGLGHGEQQLGEVAADLALDADGHDGPGEVRAGHALGDAVERLLERTAEAGLGDDPAQLEAHRLGDLLGDRLHALHERVAGPQRAGEQREGVGQQRHERLAATAGQEATPRPPGTRAASRPTMRPRMTERGHHEAEQRGDHDDGGVEEQRLAGPQRQVGPLEGGLGAAEHASLLGDLLGEMDGPLHEGGPGERTGRRASSSSPSERREHLVVGLEGRRRGGPP